MNINNKYFKTKCTAQKYLELGRISSWVIWIQSKELHGSHRSPYVVRTVKSRRLCWTGHVTRMGRQEMNIEFCGGISWTMGIE
jgi:hypothetical protein